MGETVEKLLSLPWPGFDEVWRSDALRLSKKLAKTLSEEGREDEAKALLARLPEASARDVFVRLTWGAGDAGIELIVQEPLGAHGPGPPACANRSSAGAIGTQHGHGKNGRVRTTRAPAGSDGALRRTEPNADRQRRKEAGHPGGARDHHP